MGVEQLNRITRGMPTYNGKFRTIIIDAMNLFQTYLNIASPKIIGKKNYSKKSLVTQVAELIAECSHGIRIYFYSLKKFLEQNGTIYLVFDPIGSPNYEINSGENVDMKTKEREKRKKTQEKSDLSAQFKDKLDLEYGLKTPISEIEEWKQLLDEIEASLGTVSPTIEDIFEQQYFFSQVSRQLLLTNAIFVRALKNINMNISCLYSESEADFVIKNVAYMCNSQPVLVSSRDADYFVLLADLPNVYKTNITAFLDNGIFYPYEIWKTQFGREITMDEIYALATIAGNDYTVHESICKFDLEKFKALLNINDEFKNLSSKLKLKKFVDFRPVGRTTEEQILSILKDEAHKMSMEVYRAWHLNCKFRSKQLKETEVFDALAEKLKSKFEKIYEFDVYEDSLYNVCVIENLSGEYIIQKIDDMCKEPEKSSVKLLIEESEESEDIDDVSSSTEVVVKEQPETISAEEDESSDGW